MRTKKLVFTAFFTALIMISTFVKIPMAPVPITLQSLFVALAGLLLGSKLGAVSVIAYIILGIAGLPVFSGGGGLYYVLHPTFGFLLGFLVSAFIMGKLCEKRSCLSIIRISIFSYLSFVPMYIIGGMYYYLLTKLYLGENISISYVIYYCFLLFIPGDIVKCIIAGVLGKRLIGLKI